MSWSAAGPLAALAALTLAGPPVAAAPDAAVRSVAVEGTSFRVTLADGRVPARDELPGTVLAIGDGSGQRRKVRTDTLSERDTSARSVTAAPRAYPSHLPRSTASLNGLTSTVRQTSPVT